MEEELEEEIFIDSYADRKKGRNVAERGFQWRFKKLAKKNKILLYLPINGSQTKIEDWETLDTIRKINDGTSTGT